MRQPDVAEPASPGCPATPPSRLTVLLGNRAEQWHRQVDTLLQPQGVRTVNALSGSEVLDAVQRSAVDPRQRIHVAVLDESLDGLGGLQVARVLGEQPSAPPVILLADAQAIARNLLQQALALRVFSVLNKPVELNAMLDVLARVVRRHYGNQWPGLTSSDPSQD